VRHALLIASSRFKDARLASLASPPVDAAELAAVLRDPAIGGFEVEILTNANSGELRLAIESFFAAAARDDLLLFYTSGHGIKDERGRLYFATMDTGCDRLRATALDATFISECAQASPSRKQIMIVDSCFSGAFPKGMVHRGMPNVSFDEIGTPGAGQVILTASTALQYSFEDEAVSGSAAPSRFTRHVIQGLRSGDADVQCKGEITIDELYEYVFQKLTEEGAKQSPQKWSFGAQGKLVIAHTATTRAARLPDDILAATSDHRPFVRQATIEQLHGMSIGTHRGLALAARQELERLTQDDSRAVATAAKAALVDNSPAPGPPAPDTSPPAPSPSDAIPPKETSIGFSRLIEAVRRRRTLQSALAVAAIAVCWVIVVNVRKVETPSLDTTPPPTTEATPAPASGTTPAPASGTAPAAGVMVPPAAEPAARPVTVGASVPAIDHAPPAGAGKSAKTGAKKVDRRCASIEERIQLGETINEQDHAIFVQNCQ
jgi:Caspase domain